MHRSRAALIVAAVTGVSGLVAAFQAQPRTVYISVVDKGGVPVPDLKSSDLIVTEDGHARPVLTVERASAPMKVALIVDEIGLWSPPVRESLNSIARALNGRAEIGLFSAARSEWTIIDYTEPPTLIRRIESLAPISTAPNPAGVGPLAQFLARQFQKQRLNRPVIFVLGPSAGTQSHTWDFIVNDVQRSRATVFAIAPRIEPDIGMTAEASGGHTEVVLTDIGFPSASTRMTEEILGQFALAYNSPAAPRDGFRLRVRVNRPDVIVRAPERVF